MKSFVLFVILVLSAASATAQVEPTLAIDRIESFGKDVSNVHALTIAAYPGYAPDLKVNGVHKPWGFGIAGLHPIGDLGPAKAFTGLRIDYLGDALFAPSADIGLKMDFPIAGYDVTWFAVTGVIAPLQGAGDQNFTPGAIIGAGATANIWHSADRKSSFNLFFEAEKWTQFTGIIYRPGMAMTWRF